MRCVVLMSTYNGESFVGEQLKSILSQLPLDGCVLVRDDGSNDATVSIIQSFNDARVSVSVGRNVGFSRSFFELLKHAPRNCDMYMLSDQDDVWLPGKVQRAWDHVSTAGVQPFLYCTDTQLVDDKLRPLGVGRKFISDGNLLEALTDNQVTGCTVAMNSSLLNCAVPDDCAIADVHFHDWWLYVVATSLGRVYCDGQPTILYRQHAGNHIGAGVGVFKYIKMLAYLYRRNWLASMEAQVRALRYCHGSKLSPAQRKMLDRVHVPGSGLRRWGMVFALHRHRKSWIGELFLRLLLVFDWRDSKA